MFGCKRVLVNMIPTRERICMSKNKAVCKWVYDEEYDKWETGCGRHFQLSSDESLEKNGMIYCYHCGKLIKNIPVVKRVRRG